jgi:hypothetical protein
MKMVRFENQPIAKFERQLPHSLIFLDANTVIGIFLTYMDIGLSFTNLDVFSLSAGLYDQAESTS